MSAIEKLRQPFPTNTIKVKPQSVTKDQTKGLVTYYVDARIVAERLNETVRVSHLISSLRYSIMWLALD